MKNSLRLFSVIVFAVFVSFSVVHASGQGVVYEILRRMDDYNKNLTTMRAEVTMVKVDAVLGEGDPTISTGTLMYAKQKKRDPLIRLDWRKPDESIAVVDGEYRVFRRKLEVAYKGSVTDLNKTKKSEVNTNATLAFSFMNSSKTDLKARYDISLISDKATLSNGVKAFQLRLTPKVTMNYKTAELWVDPYGMPVQIKLVEHNNDSTTILLTGSKPNVLLKKSDFLITWPPGTKVRKF